MGEVVSFFFLLSWHPVGCAFCGVCVCSPPGRVWYPLLFLPPFPFPPPPPHHPQHDKHFAAYTAKLNAALAAAGLADVVTNDASLRLLLGNVGAAGGKGGGVVADPAVRAAIRNNGGGCAFLGVAGGGGVSRWAGVLATSWGGWGRGGGVGVRSTLPDW